MNFYSRAESIDLIRLRYFQHQLNEMLKEKQFSKIPVHLAFGHEAVAVGIDLTLQPDDVLCVSHRNVAYNLARTKSIKSVIKHYRMEAHTAQIAQMASQNLAIDNTNIAYSSSILGNNLAVGAGIAMNRKIMKRAGIVFVITGDGAMEEGVFWEVMIFARSHSLGMVVVVENNNFSMSSTIAQRRTPIDLSLVCAGLNVSYRCVDGASLPAVKSALAGARDDALNHKVSLIEFNISTFCQHAGPTPGWPEDPLHIALADGLLIGDDPCDPLVHLSRTIGAREFECLVEIVMGEKAK